MTESQVASTSSRWLASPFSRTASWLWMLTFKMSSRRSRRIGSWDWRRFWTTWRAMRFSWGSLYKIGSRSKPEMKINWLKSGVFVGWPSQDVFLHIELAQTTKVVFTVFYQNTLSQITDDYADSYVKAINWKIVFIWLCKTTQRKQNTLKSGF